jgi:hypothetical protein
MLRHVVLGRNMELHCSDAGRTRWPHEGVTARRCRLALMELTRKHAAILAAIAVWNVLTYANFAWNLVGAEDRPTGYYVAHSVLIVVNTAIALLLGSWALRAWRATR